ncbi:D-2-hydroxyacid dehydrogenase [Franzmannia qiaohouensis]|uniref:D-2-hydroxyacid dehydrogenase n=1 Tax=Franzmannia qiaohouensis TaxID=1329370 RepID=A0ABU1HIK2_9GAMM|nr:D-2-hydroxyacid dehydrogenase [Halomonas qiaohouensis]MDR5907121.1 D-2-hydroxyacid dehydrogenase [Halomonas qiaohouensis]
MSTVKIVFLDRDTLSPEVVLRDLSFPHQMVVYRRTEPHQVGERISDADVVITNKVPIKEADISQASQLKLIAVAATGYDAIALEACKAAGVSVCNVRNYAINSVPEHTFSLILALRRSLVQYRQSVLDGRWEDSGQFCYFDYPVGDLSGTTLGVVGDGVLGKAVAKLGEAFGMKVLFSSHKGVSGMGSLYTPFEDVIRTSDVITLHCPLTASTRNMISFQEFSNMKRQPLIINTARGGLVDEEALEYALDTKQIGGAGFDVVTKEPPGQSHIMRSLANRPNVIVTPHVAWASVEAVQGLADQLIGNIEEYWKGCARNVVV